MKVTSEQLRQFAESPKAFRDALLIDSDSGPKPFREAVDDWQEADFAAMDAGWLRAAGRGDGGPSRAYLERPRGHSKTNDLAISVLWAIAFSSRQLSGVVAAADRQQARLLRNAIDRLVRLNDWLGAVVDVQHSTIKNTRTGSELETLSSDAAVSYGRTPDFICIDELTHWSNRDLWDSLISSAAKRANCIVVVIANAGFAESWQWDVREAVRQDPDWYFNRLEGPVASWIDPARLEEQRRLLPDPAYRRLWLNEWSSGSGDALNPEDIERAVIHSGPMQRERGWQFFGGLDLGISRDHSALCVLGRHVGFTETKVSSEKPVSNLNAALLDCGFAQPPMPEEDEFEYIEGTHKIRLAQIQSWKPPKNGKLELQQIEDAVLYASSYYGLQGVYFDPHECEFLAQRLRRAGVRMIPVPFTAGNLQSMASTLIESYASEHVTMYTHADLLLQLRQLRVVEKSYGYRLVSPRDKSGHGDLATAFVLALLGAKRFQVVPTVSRPILHGLDLPEFFDDSHDQHNFTKRIL